MVTIVPCVKCRKDIEVDVTSAAYREWQKLPVDTWATMNNVEEGVIEICCSTACLDALSAAHEEKLVRQREGSKHQKEFTRRLRKAIADAMAWSQMPPCSRPDTIHTALAAVLDSGEPDLIGGVVGVLVRREMANDYGQDWEKS